MTQNIAPAQKEKELPIEVEGTVTEAVKGKFLVQLDGADPKKPGTTILCHIAGKLRKNSIKIVQGDRVKVEISPYDLTQGRICFRLKG